MMNRIFGTNKKRIVHTICCTLLLSCTATQNIWAQKSKFKPVPDQGISGDIHGKYLGKIVFANSRISKDAPDESQFKERFKADEPLYGRYYFARSAANTPVYGYYDLKKKKSEGPCRGDCRYALKIFREGSEGIFTARCDDLYGEETKWTTFQLSVNPVPGDPEEVEKFWVNMINSLPEGEHTFRAELWFGESACSFNPLDNTGYAYVSDPVATGKFTIVKEPGVRVKFNRTFESNFEAVMSEPQLEGQMLTDVRRYAKELNWDVTFSKIAITKAWEYERNAYGVVLNRTCQVYVYGNHPEEGCAGYPFLFKQDALNDGSYGSLQIRYEGYYGKSGVDCSE